MLTMMTILLTIAAHAQSGAATAPASRGSQGKETRPAARAGHGLVYDTVRKTVILVDGDHMTDKDTPGELAAWNGRAWTVLDAKAPPPRTLAAVAFDTRRGRLVVQGGLGVGDLVHGDTLEWDGKAWQVFADGGKGPGVRNHHAAVFDAARGVVVMFGGQDRDLRPLGDTWEWDGKAWRQVATAGPAARVHHALAYDPVRKRTLLFGGCAKTGEFGDLWEWDGSAWRELRAPGAPSPRAACRMVFDAGKGEVVLFGGASDAGPFAWNGTRWRRDAGDALPPARTHHAMAYDAGRKCIVLFGGCSDNQNLGDTWERDAAGRWRCVVTQAAGR